MHLFLYEWITGGGLVEEPSPLPASLLVEGEAMVSALATDFARIPDAQVTILRDARLDPFPVVRCQVAEVHSREHHLQELERLAAESDLTLVIAPEYDRILGNTVARVRTHARHLLNASHEFIALTSDKHQTALRLADAGVAVPEAILLEADQERLPRDFPYPGVLKPFDGAGSQHTLLVTSHLDEPPPYPWPRRLERFIPGIPASVCFLCGPQGSVSLAACRQILRDDGRFGYLGGALLWETELARRATTIAQAALAALPAAHGYVGIDLVLGDADDGSQDVVIEVNPRLTTSYVGLRAMTKANLADALLKTAHGGLPTIEFLDEPLEFAANGAVRRPW